MTDLNTLPVNRHALIGARIWDADRVARLLPDNYHIALNPGIYGGEGILIEGYDVAGWTLDDYVLPRLASGLLFGSEVYYCSSCSSHDHNINTCPDQRLVFATKPNGEEYMFVGDDLTAVAMLVGDPQSYGQCQNCGSFDAAGEPTGYSIRFSTPAPHAYCEGCGTAYPVVLKPVKEVVF